MTSRAARWEGLTPAELAARWKRRNVHLYSRIDSTNNRAKELADANAPPGTIVVADEQWAGRGLGSRRWHSPRGAGLYLSLVLRPESAPNALIVPLLAGLGVARAIERLLGDIPVAIKWPNDIVIGDRKVGGVLSEVSWAGRGPNYVVVGVGVNVHQQPDDFPESLRRVAGSLDAAAGCTVARLDLADLVISEVESHCRVLPERLDRERLRRFDDYDWLRDRRCTVAEIRDEPVRGTAAGIAPDGALLFRPERGPLTRITSGRVIADELPIPDY